MTEPQENIAASLIKYFKRILNFRAILSTVAASGVIYLCVAFSTILDNYQSTSETTKMNSLTIKNIEILTGVHELKINDLNVKYEKQKSDEDSKEKRMDRIENLLIRILASQKTLIDK